MARLRLAFHRAYDRKDSVLPPEMPTRSYACSVFMIGASRGGKRMRRENFRREGEGGNRSMGAGKCAGHATLASNQ